MITETATVGPFSSWESMLTFDFVGIDNAHTDEVSAVAVTPDSADHTLKVWDLMGRAIIATFTGDSSIETCAVAPNNATIIAGEASGQGHILWLEK